MLIYNELKSKTKKIAVVGLGYVGMPLAIELSKMFDVIGFDLNNEKIKSYKKGIDVTNEVGTNALKITNVEFTCIEDKLDEASFFIVAVPTPVYKDNTPDLNCLKSASELIGRHLQKGDYVVYESTVSPGITEEYCLPILEQESGLKCKSDFKIGYSPERINPGDHVHNLKNTVKIVSGIDNESLDEISKVYNSILDNPVYKADNIKIAEAAKIVENAQRDVNIAFVNEIAMIFEKLNVNTNKVLEAAGTKWNFLQYSPGLVGGHCIGIDPYYLIYASERKGYSPELLKSCRKVNEQMGDFISHLTIRKMIKDGIDMQNAKIGILGFSFKENCPDTRNTKVFSIYNSLKSFGLTPVVADDEVEAYDVYREYKLNVIPEEKLDNLEVLIIPVAHKRYQEYKVADIEKKFRNINKKGIIIDLKGIYANNEEIISKFDWCSI